jgi:hypothetical protein
VTLPPQSGQPAGPIRPGVAPGPPYPINAEAAKISLILGLVSWLLCGIPTGIPAIIVGHRAIRKINQNRGLLKGKEIALAGLILGYASCAVWLAVLIAGFVVFRITAREMKESETRAREAIRQVGDAEESFAGMYSSASFRVYAGSLAALGPGPTGTCPGTGTREYACLLDGPLAKSDCREPQWCILSGYRFQLQVHYDSSRGADYVITAVPVDSAGGSWNFCSTSDRVLRYEIVWTALRSGYNTDECLRLRQYKEGK